MDTSHVKSREMAGRDSPLVSVIIPCYNQGHYLGEAIESILKQSYPHFEIIVVDDGSTDNTAEVARRYAEVRLLSQENQGRPAVGRNRGFRESLGDYIVFLDSDDHLLPEALETGVRLLEAHPEYAFVSGHCRAMGPAGEPLQVKQSPCIEREHYLALLHENYIWTPGVVMFRRSVLERAGCFNISMEMKGSEDYDLYMRIARESPVHCHEYAVVVYRQHGSSLSSNAATMLKSTLTVHRAQWPFVKGNKKYERAYRRGHRYWRYRYGEWVVEKVRAQLRTPGQRVDALRGIGMVLRYYPRGFVKHAGRKLYCMVFRVKD
jgi:glycosyltransferase involved in cell wall biosynthesis